MGGVPWPPIFLFPYYFSPRACDAACVRIKKHAPHFQNRSLSPREVLLRLLSPRASQRVASPVVRFAAQPAMRFPLSALLFSSTDTGHPKRGARSTPANRRGIWISAQI